MKTVCLLLTAQDRDWARSLADRASAGNEIAFVAPTLEGMLVADELGVPCQKCEDIAWSLSKTAIHDEARRLARGWFELGAVKNHPGITRVSGFLGYPLLLMHHARLTISMMEVLEAWKYVNLIIRRHAPDRIVAGHRSHPLSADKDRLYAVTGSKGLELEAARIVAARAGIELTELSAASRSRSPLGFAWVGGIVRRAWPKALRSGRSLARRLLALRRIGIPAAGFPGAASSRKVLANCYGGYYLDQISSALIKVADRGLAVLIHVTGGEVSGEQREKFAAAKIRLMETRQFKLPTHAGLKARLAFYRMRRAASRAMEDIYASRTLAAYFSDEFGSFSSLAMAAIRRELVHGVPETACMLVRSKAIIESCSPDLVVSQFDASVPHSCDVLPARKLCIPTLGMAHGVGGLRTALRDAFASEFVTVPGQVYAEALGRLHGPAAGNIFPVGDLRLDAMRQGRARNAAKADFGLDPRRPVCIYCDNSGWRMTNEWRNSELRHASEILRMKADRPALQLIFRVHHGADWRALRQFIEASGIADVTFQVSPDPEFAQIVQAADVVITHFASSIAEALVSGVPVIYLCALSEVEPACEGYDEITVVRDFGVLGKAVDTLLGRRASREEVRSAARNYIDGNLCGNDGLAAERLAEKIVELAQLPKSAARCGFDDWKRRVDACGSVRLAELLERRMGKLEQPQPVGMP